MVLRCTELPLLLQRFDGPGRYPQVLFRKGGIKEPSFTPEATTFLLFPTSFHTNQQLLKPEVAERYAEVRLAANACSIVSQMRVHLACEVGEGAGKAEHPDLRKNS